MSDVADRVVSAIEAWDVPFMELARQVVSKQVAENAPYRRYAERQGFEPGDAQRPADIPAVSTEVFKHTELHCGGPIERVFRTSGTTRKRRGEHHFPTLDVYRASIHPPFRRWALPDLDALTGDSIRMLTVAESAQTAPDSSLSFMFEELIDRWGDADSRFFVDADGVFDDQALAEALDRACRESTPVFLMGTAFGFVEFFERCDEVWSLPEGSRLIETGGFKGRKGEVTRQELYRAFEDRLGLPRSHCLSEYSMTELSSQAYTATLRAEVQGEQPPAHPRAFYTPPWVRIVLVDPTSLQPLEPSNRSSAKGLIRWVDLANVGSVCAVQTGDLGSMTEDGGLLLHGRAPEADLRGCSLTVEEWAEEGER
jgi:hypothetical protein